MQATEWLRKAERDLSEVTDEGRFEALCMLAKAYDCSNSSAALHYFDELDGKRLSSLGEMLQKRLGGQPLQYILGKWEFYGLDFHVGEGVLIPRPETEMLVDLCLSHIIDMKAPVIFDLCSGSGCIGISVAKKRCDCVVHLFEKSEEANRYAEKNIALNGLKNVFLHRFDITDVEAVSEVASADVILSNPPYVRSDDISSLQSEVLREPHMALDGGNDGLYFYKVIADIWVSHLNSGGMLAVEIGEDQADEVKHVFSKAPLDEIKSLIDIYDNPRVVTARRINYAD